MPMIKSMRITLGFVVCLVLGAARGQETAPSTAPIDTPVVLKESGTVVLDVGSFYATGNGQCDQDGNFYFNTARDFNSSAIMKLKPDGSHRLYLPAAPKEESYFVAFRVNASGVVYLLNGGREKIFLHEFSSESGNSRATELEVPHGLEPTNFLVLGDGQILILGYFTDKASPETQGRSYVGFFDASGRLRHQTSQQSAKSITEDIKANSWTLFAAAAALAENGHGYLLSGDDILEISPTEGLINRFHLNPPDEGYGPMNIFAISGRLLVSFIKHQKQWPLPVLYEFLDASTGELIHKYKPAEEMGNNLVCFSKEGFTFLRVDVKKGKLKLINAKP